MLPMHPRSNLVLYLIWLIQVASFLVKKSHPITDFAFPQNIFDSLDYGFL